MSVRSLDDVVEGRRSQPQQLVEVLLDVQERFGHIPQSAMLTVSKELGVPLIEVWRVANFYKAFSLEPRGRHLITVCSGTACHVRGSARARDHVTAELGIEPGGTTADGMFTLEEVNCLGVCALAPVVVLDGVYHAGLTPRKLSQLLEFVRKNGGEDSPHA